MRRLLITAWLLAFVVYVFAANPEGDRTVNKHWTVNSNLFANNMTIVGVIELNGAELRSDTYEIGAFSGTECRGSEILNYYGAIDRYLVYFTVYGDGDEEIDFKLYNHENGYEFVEATIASVTFEVNAMHGLPSSPYVFAFDCPVYNITCQPNAAPAGTVSGGGAFFYGQSCTVSARAKTGYQFKRWTENGVDVSSSRNYSFSVSNSRNLTAVFACRVTDTLADACETFSWHGHTYTSSGVYHDTLTSYLGLDSVVNLHLTIHPANHIDLPITECEVYYWDDEPFYESGDYSRHYYSVYGCDSIETLHLTILPIRQLGNFTYMSPANNYIDRYTDMDFYWDAIPNADRYDFYFWQGEGGKPNTPTLANTTSHSYHVNGLTHGTTYHWCVVAKNDCVENESDTRTFTCQLNPAMTVVPNGMMDFGEVELGQTKTKTIAVSGTALTEDISVAFLENALGQDAEFFEITPSNWNNMSGGMLHVTFVPAPTQLYYNAAIRIASGAFVDTVYFTGAIANRYVFTTEVDGEVFSANDDIIINGHVEDVLGNPVSDMTVNVYLMVMGTRTTATAVSDVNGNYSTTYTPCYSESGYYQVGSCAYGTYSNEVHDAFDIPGMSRVSSDFIIWTPYQDETLTGTIEIRNRSRIPISNINVETVSLPNGCTVSFSGTTNLGPLEVGQLNYTVTGTQVSTGTNYEEANFVVNADNGITMNMTCYYYCRQRRGSLAVYPPSVSTTMKRYNQKVLSFQVANNGNGETGPITVSLPNVEWMSILGGNTLESLPVGDSCAFSIMLTPDENVDLVHYSGSIAVNCANGNGVTIPYAIEATSDSTGVLMVDVTDDNTYNGNGDHLAGADVYLKGYYSLEMVAQGVTDENGLFTVENVPEGYYYLTIHATQHKGYEAGIIYIEGGKTNHQNIYLQFQAISYSWVVVPTEVEDEYEFELVAQIATNVPVPVVTVDCPSKIDTLAYGDTIQFNLTVTNHGLVDALDTQLTMPTEFPEYDFIPMIDFIDTLHAKTSVVIPCIVTRTQRDRNRLNDYHCHLGSGRTISGYYCNQEKEWVEFTFTIGFRVYCNFTGPNNPIVHFPSSTTPSTPTGTNVGPNFPLPSGSTGGPGGPGSGGSGSTANAGSGVDNVTTTSQDCTPCWQMFDLPLNRLMISPELQDLMRQSRSCTSASRNLACPGETDSLATEWPLWARIGDLSKIDPELQTLMRDSRDGNETFRIIVEMKNQYDNPNLERGTAMMTRAERREYVVNELKRFSESSQAEVSRYLDALATRGGVRVLHHFWIFNGVCCEATASCIDELSMRNDVRYVSLDKKVQLDEPIERIGNDDDNPPEGVQWHVSRVQANHVWNIHPNPNNQEGITGKGVVVAIIDSGVNYNHIDIKDNMWVWYYDENQNPVYGWDFCNDDAYPLDDNGHGSHVAGIVASGNLNSTYRSGVAPDATIMALKALDETNSGFKQNLIRAIEFAVEHGADVLNLSFGQDGVGGDAIYRKTFDDVLKAGVAAVVAAGNNGNRPEFQVPYNIGSTGACPPPWRNPYQVIPEGEQYKPSAVICVGATINNDDNTIASYSSIGPVTWTEGQLIGNDYNDFPLLLDDSYLGGLIRPDVVAPGGAGIDDEGPEINSLSHTGNSGYCWNSGTSMAAPCVSGVIALMLDANPNLTPEKIDEILETTATHIPWGNETGKNNHYGSGLVNAYTAVTAALNTNMPQKFHISIDQNPFGICETVSGGGYYEHGETCTLQASPAEYFLHWKKNGNIVYEDGAPASAEYSFEVIEDAQYTACFDESLACYYVSITANLGEGVSKVLLNGVEVHNNDVNICYGGQSCTVFLTPNPGYWFCGWDDGEGIVLSPKYTFNVDRNIKLTAMLAPIPSNSYYGPGTVVAPPTIQDLGSEDALLQSVLDAINNCLLCNRNVNWGENLAEQLGQCRNFYQSILNVYTNLFQEAEWMEEQNIAQFLDNFYAFVDPIDQTVSPQSTQQLIEMSEFTSANASTVQSFVERWNRSVQYWNEGIYTLADLPEGYNPNFVQKDGTMLQPGEAACEYATANGFDNFAQMYYTTLSDCSDLFVEHQTDVCAKISVSFKQTMTMTREAFEGTLKIFNGHTTDPMQNINVDIVIKDENGVDRTDLFQINVTSLSDITGVDGTGTLNAQTEGIAQFIMIPTIEAAPETTKIYSFGGSFSFLDPFSGSEMTYNLFPVQLKVNPGPDLHVDYFISRYIISDDPLTDSIEPTEPAELAMMIRNVGAGDANNVYLESSQPQIIENQNGLLISFDMVGAAMNGVPRPLGLTDIPFGTIESHSAGIAEWYFTSTLMARVIGSTPHVIHNNSYDNPNLSLVTELNSHDLIKAITAYGSLEDGINDFFVNETPDFNHTPDKIYFSNGGTASVRKILVAETEGVLSETNNEILLHVNPIAVGWNYACLDDPAEGLREILSCTRDDGQEIPLSNVWITHVTMLDEGAPVHENKLHIVDTMAVNQATTYTLVYGEAGSAATTMQSMSLTQGWNWWSTYVEMNNVDGLSMLENSLGHKGVTIKSQFDFVQNFYSDYGEDVWFGSLEGITNEQGYMINVTEDCTSDMRGLRTRPTSHPITLQPNWNWIGYPVDSRQGIASALAGFNASPDDLVKSHYEFSVYYDGFGWFPDDFIMTPGEGYFYYSNAPASQILTYNNGRGATLPQKSDKRMWKTDVHAFADNLSVMAVVSIDSVEQRDENLELGAFVDGECRGSARLKRFGPFDRYYAMLSVSGQEGDKVGFGFVNKEKGQNSMASDNHLTFVRNDIVGSLGAPYIVRFDTKKEASQEDFMVLFPNPVERGKTFSLEIPKDETLKEVVIVDMLGEEILRKTGALKRNELEGLPVAGIYVVKATTQSGKVYHGRLIVK